MESARLCDQSGEGCNARGWDRLSWIFGGWRRVGLSQSRTSRFRKRFDVARSWRGELACWIVRDGLSREDIVGVLSLSFAATARLVDTCNPR